MAAAHGLPTQLMPIYLSGSSGRELMLGQPVQQAAQAVANLKRRRSIQEQKVKSEGGSEQPAKESSQGTKPTASSGGAAKPPAVSLKELLDAGLIKPGSNNVTLIFKGSVYRASLLDSGHIQYQGTSYPTPGAFSLKVKQLHHPGKQSDEGFRAVHVDGVSLEDIRHKFLASRGGSSGGATSSGAAEGPAAAATSSTPAQPSIYEQQLSEGSLPPLPSTYDALLPKEDEPEGEAADEAGDGEPDTSNWVQCSRCQTWRVVPDEFWPDIEAAGDEDWYCEESTWDLTHYDPFTKGCKEYGS